ncbi:hypothetical protein D3C76_1390540 [compost metagenome]
MRTQRLRHGVGHRAVVERANQAAFAVHFQIACRPDGGRPDIAGENGVVRGEMTDLLGEVLRVNGFLARFGEIVQPFACVTIVAERLVEELAIGFLLQMRE